MTQVQIVAAIKVFADVIKFAPNSPPADYARLAIVEFIKMLLPQIS